MIIFSRKIVSETGSAHKYFSIQTCATVYTVSNNKVFGYKSKEAELRVKTQPLLSRKPATFYAETAVLF